MWMIRSRWLRARPQQLHSVSNGATAALRQALDMVSSRNVAVQISIAISSPRHHNNNNKLYLNLDITIYNPHLALIGYVVPILNVMLGGEEIYLKEKYNIWARWAKVHNPCGHTRQGIAHAIHPSLFIVMRFRTLNLSCMLFVHVHTPI